MRKHRLAKRAPEPVRTKFFALTGGLNLVDPPIQLKPGFLISCLNHELGVRGGYRRIDGIERFDGQTSPSEASYWILGFDNGSVEVTAGDVVDGATGTGLAVIDAVLESGSYAGGDAAGYLVLTEVTTGFVDNETLSVSATPVATANGTETERGAATLALDIEYYGAAVEVYRALIGMVPGSGNIRGVHILNGNVYAFRDNAGGTACVMHKATVAGWVAQDLGNQVAFTAGTAAFAEGETLTGGVSGATATIKRVVLRDGSFSGGDASGYIILGTVTGTFQAETVTSASGSATCSGAQTTNTLPAGGRYEAVNHNFLATGAKRMYGVNGVGTAFEWDGSVFAPIATGSAVDTPTHVVVHKDCLFLGFASGSIQLSDVGLPYEIIDEIGLGDRLVGFKVETGDVLLILGRTKTKMLYGNPTDGWQEPYTIADESGGLEWSLQRLGASRYLDDRGIVQLAAVQEYGNFKDSAISQLIDPLLKVKRELLVSSIIVREKNQYRLFFSDGTGISMTLDGRKLAGFTFFSYENPDDSSPLPVLVTANGDSSAGKEVMYFGSDTGYVYQMDKGTSMDGAAIDASMQPVYYHLGAPEYEKQFHEAVLEVDARAGTELNFRQIFDYGDSGKPVGVDHMPDVAGGRYGGTLDVDLWDAFDWSGESDYTRARAGIDGIGTNISLIIASSQTYVAPYTLSGVTYHYVFRRLAR